MLKLSQTAKFKKDLEKFKQGITKIQKPVLRTEYEKILEEFVKQCHLIDNAHSTEFNRRIAPENIRDSVIELAKLRKKLQNFLDNT